MHYYCFSYTDLNINVISLIASLIITVVCSNFFSSLNKVKLNTKMEGYYNTNESIAVSNNEKTNEVVEKNKDIFTNSLVSASGTDIENPDVWKIEIPKISLIADISEGTDKEILDVFVGHFKETKKENGNIGLAAHNRGYNVNYFGRIKELVIGDEIYYTYGSIKKKYKVCLITIIKDTEWTYLENTEDNRITLITCLEDEPEYRRCIQGIEF